MSKKNNDVPDWFQIEADRSEELLKSGKKVNNPSASKDSKIKKKKITRSVKGFYLRNDYHVLFDQFTAKEKHESGKKSPDLIEEAIEDLFKKYKFKP